MLRKTDDTILGFDRSAIKGFVDECLSLRQQQRHAEAEQVIRTGIAQFPNEHDGWNELGKIQRDTDRLGDALHSFATAYLTGQDSLSVATNLGCLSSKMRQYAAANEVFAVSFFKYEPKPFLLGAMGEHFRRAGNPSFAAVCFEKGRIDGETRNARRLNELCAAGYGLTPRSHEIFLEQMQCWAKRASIAPV